MLSSLIVVASNTTENANESSEKATSNPVLQAFRIVGYVADWDHIDQIQFNKLTHVICACLFPEPDGSFSNVESLSKLKEGVKKAHDNGVKVLISVAGSADVFEALTADTNARKTFVDGLQNCVNDYDLDGVDLDWEYPINETSDNYLILLHELREALPGKLLTSAVAAFGPNADNIPSEAFKEVDFLNIMAYDSNITNHSPYSLSEKAIDYWRARGLSTEKIVLGVPFYSRPSAIHYSELMQTNPAAANMDELDFNGSKEYYNGIPTIQKKTELAISRAGGIMIWELGYDTNDNTSLLNAIYQMVSRNSLSISIRQSRSVFQIRK